MIRAIRFLPSSKARRTAWHSLPLAQWDVRREFLRRLKKAFDARGIEIPYPHLTVYAGEGKDGEAPPFRVLAKTFSGAAKADDG